MNMLEESISEDEETTADADMDGGSAAEYSFEGFEVDFSEKVDLLPPERQNK